MRAKKRMTSWLSLLLALSCLLYSIPPVTVWGSSGDFTDFAQGIAYETNWQDDEFNGGHGDPTHTKLTDGVTTANLFDENCLHFRYRESGDPITLDFDLSEPRDLYQVNILGIGGSYGVMFPMNYSIAVYSEEAGDWVTVYQDDAPSDAVDRYTYEAPLENAPVRAQKVRISMTPNSTFLGLTDVQIFGRDGEIEEQGDNLLLGIPYETILKDGDANKFEGDYHPQHTDEGRSRLTDGKKAFTSDWRDNAVVGLHTPCDPEVADKRVPLTFSFDGVKPLEQISFSVFQEPASWIHLPSHLLMEYQDEQGIWRPLYDGDLPQYEDAKCGYDYVAPDGAIRAQAVRFFFTSAGWVFIDEIEAFSEATAKSPNLVPSSSVERPVFTKNLPTSLHALAGESVTLSVEAEVSEGTLSYQWFKDGEEIGSDSAFLTFENIVVSDSGSYKVVVTNTGEEDTASVQSATCLLTVTDPSVEAAAPEITKNLPAALAVSVGEAVVLEVEATSPDGGSLSYQWFKDGEAIGSNSPSLSIESADVSDSGNYSVTITNQKGEFTKSVESGICALTVKKEFVSLIGGLAYETELPDTEYHGSYPDPDHTKLTDGKKGSQWNSDASVGFHTQGNVTVNLEYNLDAAIAFSEINIGYFGGAFGIENPASIEVAVKDGDEWQTLYKGRPKSSGAGDDAVRNEMVLTANEPIRASSIRFSFQGAGAWTFLDEIGVFAEATGAASDGVLGDAGEEPTPPTPSDDNNLALGKSYTVSQPVSDEYPDSTGKELTDGVEGGLSIGDPAWMGCNFWHPQGRKALQIILDLERVEEFEEVRMNLLHSSGGVSIPENFSVSISDDKNSWTELKSGAPTFDVIVDLGETQEFERVKAGFLKADAEMPSDFIYHYVYTSPQKMHGRYLKIECDDYSWVFFDEVKVLKEALVREPAVAEKAAVSGIVPDSNNIAYGRPYETQWPFSEVRPDSDEGKLTDGKRGTASARSKDWVGYSAIEGLGGYRSWKSFSSTLPTYVEVSYSDDKEFWHSFGSGGITDVASGIQRFDYASSQPVSGRYVKFTVSMDQMVALDEIEILKEDDGLADGEENPDNGLRYNLINGYGASPSRPASSGDASVQLTDGNRLEYLTFGLGERVVVDFDLTSNNSISEILMHARSGAQAPQNVVFKVSNDAKDWVTLKTFGGASSEEGERAVYRWAGDTDFFYSNLENAAQGYIRYLRVEFDAPAGGALISEVEMFGKRGKCSDAGLVLNRPGEHYNVALGKPYQTIRENYIDPLPDTGGTELTDGIKGSESLADPAWSAYWDQDVPDGKRYELWPIKTFVIDLQDVKTITSLNFNMIGGKYGIVGANKPWVIRTYASMDGEKWMQLSQNSDINIWLARFDSFGWHHEDTNGVSRDLSGADMVACRYVRVDLELTNWGLVDEIEVMGYDGVREGALMADTGRYLENGQEFLTPGERTGGIGDLVLCYNGWYGYEEDADSYVGDWTPEQYKPYLTYIDYDGNSVDTMYDGVLLLGLISRYGRYYFGTADEPAVQARDWKWYIDKLFKEGGDVANLNEAAKQAAADLHQPDYKVKLVISIASPPSWSTDFGVLDDENRPLDFSNLDDQRYAIRWYLDQVFDGIENGDYEYIDFCGIYWLSEGMGDDNTMVQYTADLVHEKGYLMYWIPFFKAYGSLWSEKAGIDATAMQVNHFFDNPLEPGTAADGGMTRVLNTGKLASYAQIGVEMEFDSRVFDSPWRYNLYLDYLNGGIEAGFDGPDAYRAWYQGVRDIGRLAYSNAYQFRALYDYTYQFMKGTLEPVPYVQYFNSAPTPGAIGRGDYGNLPSGGGSGGLGGSSGLGGGGSTPGKPSTPSTPSTDEYTWEETEDGYRLKDKNGDIVTGWAKVSGKWYYLNSDGLRTTGWQKVDNVWYYLKEDGQMAVGWLKLGNAWYYLKSSGAMAVGWLYDNGSWYWLYGGGSMANSGWVQVNNAWYYLKGNGAMATGWLKVGDSWYYLKSNGVMATGWNWIGSHCYYFNAAGKMAANTTVNGYKVGRDGAWVR